MNQPHNTPLSADDELRKLITEVKDRLAGRIETHRKVAKLSGWTAAELNQVIKEDGWIFEDEMLSLLKSDRKKHELQAEIASNEAWYALGRMIDPREFVAEIGRLELKKQELEKL